MKILFLMNIHIGCKSIIPSIVQIGSMIELIELLLCESNDIVCVINASKCLGENDIVLSKLNKLIMQNIKSLETFFHGEPSPGLFDGLEKL